MPSHGTHEMSGARYKKKKCLDCPAVIPVYGKRDRCAPCADLHYVTNKRVRDKERRARAKAAAQQEKADE